MAWHRIGAAILIIVAAGWARGAPIGNDEKADAPLQQQVTDIARRHHGKVALFARNLKTGAAYLNQRESL